jgi:hypothetical protein
MPVLFRKSSVHRKVFRLDDVELKRTLRFQKTGKDGIVQSGSIQNAHTSDLWPQAASSHPHPLQQPPAVALKLRFSLYDAIQEVCESTP